MILGGSGGGLVFDLTAPASAFSIPLLAGETYTFTLESRVGRRDDAGMAATGAVHAEFAWNILYDRVAPVPEPATWATLIVGFAAAGSSLRRRRSAFAAVSA